MAEFNPDTALYAEPDALTYSMVVYLALNNVTGEFYVGATRKPLRVRRHGHLSAAARKQNGSPKFYRAIRKYTPAVFQWFVLEVCSSVENLLEAEIQWIAKLGPKYNITDGGQGVIGAPRTKSWRAKISKSLMGHPGSNSMLGKKHTESAKAKLRAHASANAEVWKQYIHLGSSSMKKALVDLETGTIYSSAKEASLGSKTDLLFVKKSCRGVLKERRFRFLTEEECVSAGLPFSASHNWNKERRDSFKRAGAAWKSRPVVSIRTSCCYPSVAAAREATANPKRMRGRNRSSRNLPSGCVIINGQPFAYLRASVT